jgi:hypothetical protein
LLPELLAGGLLDGVLTGVDPELEEPELEGVCAGGAPPGFVISVVLGVGFVCAGGLELGDPVVGLPELPPALLAGEFPEEPEFVGVPVVCPDELFVGALLFVLEFTGLFPAELEVPAGVVFVG